MPFWTYMLHCADRSFYVGHTDDLDVRLTQHEQGTLGGYTHDRRPVHLVWSDEFPTRYEALSSERRIKGWSRAKKLALIRGDWSAISALARNRENKEGPSTSSGRTDGERGMGELSPNTARPEPVEGLPLPYCVQAGLMRHPGFPSSAVAEIGATASLSGRKLTVAFTLKGHMLDLLIPLPAASVRTDGLWRHTCFEAFIADDTGAYCELNLSPSMQWAAYRFDGYREGMIPWEIGPPIISTGQSDDRFDLQAVVTLARLPATPLRLGLSAVIEATDGHLSYWALAHPPGAPDFHHPDCFAATLVSQGAP